jgi:hypothetical protein
VPPDSLFVTISQSGETADTLAALRMAKTAGYAATLTLCNVATSTIVRESDLALTLEPDRKSASRPGIRCSTRRPCVARDPVARRRGCRRSAKRTVSKPRQAGVNEETLRSIRHRSWPNSSWI